MTLCHMLAFVWTRHPHSLAPTFLRDQKLGTPNKRSMRRMTPFVVPSPPTVCVVCGSACEVSVS